MTTLLHGLFYGAVVTVYLFLFMMTASPRIWGYADYSDAVKSKVPPQTKKEKVLGMVIGLPWLLFIFGFPITSTILLKAELGGHVSFPRAFVHVLILVFLATFGDLVLLDWLVISKITPKFVIIPGTAKADYKDFSHHYRAHARAAVPLVVLSAVVAGLASVL